MKDLQEVVNEVKNVKEDVNLVIIPILKDSIKDGNHHNKRLFVINMMLVLSLVIISIISMIIINRQNEKYAEFLSQFEFETTTYQDFDTRDNSNVYNPVINN